jgi:NADH-quinone oxidoreductase subunit L
MTIYHAIVFLPLIGFLIAGLFGHFIGARASEVATTGLLLVAAVLSWVGFVQVGFGDAATRVSLATWMTSGSLQVDWALRIDTLTVVMLVVVTTVSALVHVYSIGYMHEDGGRPRFFAYLSLFTFAMLALVTADNLVQLFFGWEGVGLASYLLIGFWYDRPSANAAAIKAFIVNRVGDFGFALGIFLLFALTNSVAFDAIFPAAQDLAHRTIYAFGMDVEALTLVCLLLFMGACGKSAQFLLHTWLPDAMEGPTPVSALIHAATMVTAGVFMVARLSPLFVWSPAASSVVITIGATTAFFAATVGLVQNDIKRVIAYSTCSQLGYMFVGLGVGGYSIGMFHLFTHAFFKALLFLGAGSVIQAMHHEQDMRHMGGLAKRIPYTFWAMVIGTVSLTGFPLTAGFFSKDAIIEASYVSSTPGAVYGFFMTVVVVGLTSFYAWRLIFMTFFGPEPHAASALPMSVDHAAVDRHATADGHISSAGHGGGEPPHESPAVMLVPLAVLSFGAIFAGLAFRDLFTGEAASAFWKGSLPAQSLSLEEPHSLLRAMHEVPAWVAFSPFLMMVAGFFVAVYMYILAPESAAQLATRHAWIYRFLLNKWYFDELYDFLFVRPAFWLGELLWKGGDGRVIDGMGPDGVAARVVDVTNRVIRLQTGYVYHYAFAMLLGVAGFVTWYLVGGAR